MMPTSASFRLLIASTLLAGPAQAQYPRPPEDIRKKLAAWSATVEANNETAWEKAKPEVLAGALPLFPGPLIKPNPLLQVQLETCLRLLNRD